MSAIRHLAPAAAALALVFAVGGDPSEMNDDLQLSRPDVLFQDATTAPVRARVYTDLRAPEGPRLVAPSVAVALQTRSGRVLGRGTLAPARGALGDLEANLPLTAPLDADQLMIVANTTHDGHPLDVRAEINVRRQPDARALEGRSLRGLQQFSAGPTLASSGAIAPDPLAVQVRGGACVPEQPCRILVHVGEPAAALRIEANSTVTPPPTAAAETSAVVAFDIVTHGPEAELWLRAYRGDTAVARRAVRLPIALGALSAAASGVVLAPGERPELRGDAADGGCIVDAFRAGHWTATGSLAVCGEQQPIPFDLPAGLWRLQLRRDSFSADSAGVRVVYLQAPGETAAATTAALVQAAHQSAPDDALVRACRAQGARCEPSLAQEYLVAILEGGLAPSPAIANGHPERVDRLRERRATLRSLALGALVLGALGLALSIGQSGMTAGVRASQLLSDDPAHARRARLRAAVRVAASVGSLVMVFVVLALYVLARAGP
ncbi:MAG: hypothetical protein ABW321_16840 [Polyangiales bacterium]